MFSDDGDEGVVVEEEVELFFLCRCCCWSALALVAAMRCPVGPSGTGGPGTVRTVWESVTLERGTGGEEGEELRLRVGEGEGGDEIVSDSGGMELDLDLDADDASSSVLSSTAPFPPLECLLPAEVSGEGDCEWSVPPGTCWLAEARTRSPRRRGFEAALELFRWRRAKKVACPPLVVGPFEGESGCDKAFASGAPPRRATICILDDDTRRYGAQKGGGRVSARGAL